ncbi:MAG: hypothetical protein NTW57_06760 [Methylophilales bacterium]|nr:hypothetical protein [Methylophilales bacterium]
MNEMVGNLKSKTSNAENNSNLQNQLSSSKLNFYPNSAYRSEMKKIDEKLTKPVGLVTKYIDAMIAYDALRSDENYKYLEEVKKEYKDFLALKK